MGAPRHDLTTARKAAGHTQESLAEALGIDVKSVRNWENGTYRPDRLRQQRLANELGIPRRRLSILLTPEAATNPSSYVNSDGDRAGVAGQTGQNLPDTIPELRNSEVIEVRRQEDISRPGRAAPSLVHADIPILRRVLDSRDLPDDGPVRPLDELVPAVRAVVVQRMQSDYSALSAEVLKLLPELHRAILAAPPGRKPQYAALLARAYRAADAIADKFGYYDLSARIIDLLKDAALKSEEDLLIGSAEYVRGEIFFASEDLDTGRRVLTAAADKIRVSASERAAATYGSLHMRAAVMAARAGSALRARDHIEEAQQSARKVNEGVHLGTAFGAASVRIHRLSLAVEIGDVGAALRLASGWAPPTTMPAERRSHFYIELGRAFHLADRPERVLSAFGAAKRIAPEHVCEHSQVIDVIDHLELTTRGGTRDAFRRFAAGLVKPQGRNTFGL
ncbi:multiprotein-bridging factor 1 family protein [Amycolatopsis japonica]|uniref:helix-turn-helix domain-containing protein n=1 Tax=Amycolatopsis japonica TaxID=208439 RepID=UPI00366DD862